MAVVIIYLLEVVHIYQGKSQWLAIIPECILLLGKCLTVHNAG